MIQTKKIKNKRIKINNLKEFKGLLIKEGYVINSINEEEFKYKVKDIFDLDNKLVENLNSCLEDDLEYRAKDIEDFIDYIKKITCFEERHNILCEKIIYIDKLRIDRIEYEREPSMQENIDGLIHDLNKIKSKVSTSIEKHEMKRLLELEKAIDLDYLYAKDIELLKNMIIANNNGIEESYDEETKVKTLVMHKDKEIDFTYIKHKKGSVEYHKYLNNNIPRMDRLIRNIDKYIKKGSKENITVINQSSALQDSINIAVANYDGKEFKAISGSNEIKYYCKSPNKKNMHFRSRKVNKLGKLGIGYDRVNDSEKKIFEEIHSKIEENKLKDSGELILYSKWEPCPSCYLVIDQFCKRHPNIDVKIKWYEVYGEKKKRV